MMWSLLGCYIVLIIGLFLEPVLLVNSFVLPQPLAATSRSVAQKHTFIEPSAALRALEVSEYSTYEEDEDENGETDAPLASIDQNEAETAPGLQDVQYAALSLKSATVQIQVGDLALARKAWKKRRRSGSPLLVPCSILNLDRTSMLRSNLVYLLYKFGSSQKDGIVISLKDLKLQHKKHLKSPLSAHASALGYETSQAMLEALFQGVATQDTYGVQLVPHEDNELYLKARISKYVALKKVDKMTVLQVATEPDEPDTMRHTGFIRRKREEEKGRFYEFLPLSAALRASQREDVETGHIQNGSLHPAVLFDFDPQGDGGAPLLTLSLNPSRQKVSKKSTRNGKGANSKYIPIKNPRHLLDNLQIGQGPYNAKIVRLGQGHALVDIGVGRKFQTGEEGEDMVGSPEFVKVHGVLRFKDAIEPMSSSAQEEVHEKQHSAKTGKRSASDDLEDLLKNAEKFVEDVEDGEQAEDITHLFELNESGELTYKNPETGEVEVVSSAEDDEGGDDDDVDVDGEDKDEPVTFVNNVSPSQQRRKAKTLFLKVGEKVPVYILSVPKHSNQFMVTTDPSLVQGKKAKDIKREGDVSKKLDRLSQLLGGLGRAEELKGKEYYGTVKATSQTGDWLYVQPENDEDLNLPVGVATISADSSTFAQGDRVRIRMDGIDQSRGQLAMHVLEKLSP